MPLHGVCLLLKVMLPKLPVPSLSHTLEMYLKVLRPITTDSQYENARKLAEQFQSEGEGERLQARLTEFARSTDNWVSLFGCVYVG